MLYSFDEAKAVLLLNPIDGISTDFRLMVKPLPGIRTSEDETKTAVVIPPCFALATGDFSRFPEILTEDIKAAIGNALTKVGELVGDAKTHPFPFRLPLWAAVAEVVHFCPRVTLLRSGGEFLWNPVCHEDPTSTHGSILYSRDFLAE
jgi:hypothetical protein